MPQRSNLSRLLSPLHDHIRRIPRLLNFNKIAADFPALLVVLHYGDFFCRTDREKVVDPWAASGTFYQFSEKVLSLFKFVFLNSVFNPV
jgi:hypothetical protein